MKALPRPESTICLAIVRPHSSSLRPRTLVGTLPSSTCALGRGLVA